MRLTVRQSIPTDQQVRLNRGPYGRKPVSRKGWPLEGSGCAVVGRGGPRTTRLRNAMVCQAGNLPDCMSLARLMEGGFKVAKIGKETVYLGAAAVGGLRSAICDFRSHRIGNW